MPAHSIGLLGPAKRVAAGPSRLAEVVVDVGSGPGGIENPIVLGPKDLIYREGRSETLVRIPSLAESDADNQAITVDVGVHLLHSDAVGPVARVRAMLRKNAAGGIGQRSGLVVCRHETGIVEPGRASSMEEPGSATFSEPRGRTPQHLHPPPSEAARTTALTAQHDEYGEG